MSICSYGESTANRILPSPILLDSLEEPVPMTEEYGNSLRSTRRQSRELHFHNWDSFHQTRDLSVLAILGLLRDGIQRASTGVIHGFSIKCLT